MAGCLRVHLLCLACVAYHRPQEKTGLGLKLGDGDGDGHELTSEGCDCTEHVAIHHALWFARIITPL